MSEFPRETIVGRSTKKGMIKKNEKKKALREDFLKENLSRKFHWKKQLEKIEHDYLKDSEGKV